MNKNNHYVELENLIKIAQDSRIKIKANTPIFAILHLILGIAMILSGYHTVNIDNIYAKIWGTCTGIGWVSTIYLIWQYRSKPEEVSVRINKFTSMWVIIGVLLTIIGFSSYIDKSIFPLYPFFFGMIMATLLVIFRFVFDLLRLNVLALIWVVSSISTLFLPFNLKFYLIGFVCFLVPIFLYVSSKNDVEYTQKTTNTES